jgi:hypothetical protein
MLYIRNINRCFGLTNLKHFEHIAGAAWNFERKECTQVLSLENVELDFKIHFNWALQNVYFRAQVEWLGLLASLLFYNADLKVAKTQLIAEQKKFN